MNNLSNIILSATVTANLTDTLKAHLRGFTNIVQSFLSEIKGDPQFASLQFQVLAILTIVNLTCFLASLSIFMINRYKQSSDPEPNCDDGADENEIDLKYIKEASFDAKTANEKSHNEREPVTRTALIKYVNRDISGNKQMVSTPLYMTSQLKMKIFLYSSSQSIPKKIFFDPVWIFEQMKQVHVQTRMIKNNKSAMNGGTIKVEFILPKAVTESYLDLGPQISGNPTKQLLITNFAHNEKRVKDDQKLEGAQKELARTVLMLLIVTGLF